MKQWMQISKKAKVISVLLFTILLAGILVPILQAQTKKEEEEPLLREYPVTKGNITTSIDGGGTVELENSPYSFDVTVTLKTLFAKIGQTVQKGDHLAEIDTDLVQKQIDSLNDDLKKANNALEDAINQKKLESISHQQVQNNEREDSLIRYEQERTAIVNSMSPLDQTILALDSEIARLQKKLDKLEEAEVEIISGFDDEQGNDKPETKKSEQIRSIKQQLEQERAARQEADDRRSAIQKELEALDSARNTEVQRENANSNTETQKQGFTHAQMQNVIDNARLEVQNIEKSIEAATKVLQNPFLVAEDSGVVIAAEFQEGDEIPSGKPIVELGKDGKKYVSVTILQDEILCIAQGQEVELDFVAWPGEKISGNVLEINQDPVTIQNDIGYAVLIEINENELELLNGMTCSVKFITKQVKDVLQISNKAITLRDGRQFVTILLPDGTLQEQEVTTGFSDGRVSEIKTGLSEGDIAIVEG